MAQSPKKSIRKLVTLSAELAERVDKFRESSGASSESDALKALIEDGLKMRDKPQDLFTRFESATLTGQSISEIINLLSSDHPLVASTYLDSDTLIINLRTETDAPNERFRYSRYKRSWHWEYQSGGYDNWESVDQQKVAAPKDLDDEIPF